MWRWAFMLVIPAVAWMLVPWALGLDAWTIGIFVLAGLSVSLMMLGMSQTMPRSLAVDRAWVLGAVVFPPWMAGTEALVSHGWPGWWGWPLLTVCLLVAYALKPAVDTVLPTTAVTDAILAAEEAFENWRRAVRAEGVWPVLRAELRSRQPVRGTTLRYDAAEGLRRGGSLISHQPVLAGQKLAALVGGLNGGSFALAGPRGAGKSSLLEAFCEGAYRRSGEQLDLAIVVPAPVDYVPREFVLHLYARTCHAVLTHLEETQPFAVKTAGTREAWWGPVHTDHVRLVQAARRGLQDIAFVQTRSGETSGKFGFRGAEISYKRGLSLSGRPATFPELVGDFRGFVRFAARTLEPMRVVIAIDEMDRIGAGEQARRFLNEIKAIFDVPGCYYLMSVSTEAQHDFELAGTGLRSVFDSSFDEVIRVDYLDFDLAKGLISRSVEGLPDSFAALAYAFSGGLARQLMRTARGIVRQDQGTPLATVAEELVRDELDRVCKTVGDALTVSQNQDGVTALLRALADPAADLHSYGKAIQAAYDGEDTAVSGLRDLAAARVEFLAAVRDYFTNDLAEIVPAQVNALARARRYAGSNPATGLALLEEFSAALPARPAPGQSPR
ncbi:hypothetical protein ABZX92_27975 [Lentzea sp. NPDC006480]|uniref:hypothetical protein n=1 Tax=Lentzea sp. NPDC006480 TaxID=3157176 RepID=UPI0033B28742